jgi:hypothetical protein
MTLYISDERLQYTLRFAPGTPQITTLRVHTHCVALAEKPNRGELDSLEPRSQVVPMLERVHCVFDLRFGLPLNCPKIAMLAKLCWRCGNKPKWCIFFEQEVPPSTCKVLDEIDPGPSDRIAVFAAPNWPPADPQQEVAPAQAADIGRLH